MEKKGVSPIIATVLLIGIVIVIAVIVFVWIRGIQEEAIVKFTTEDESGTNVKLICESISYSATYSGGKLYLGNTGNVPIYRFKVRLKGSGSEDTHVLGSASGETWSNSKGLLQGERISVSLDASLAEEILLIPMLVGSTEKGIKSYTCDERLGRVIEI